MAFMAALPSIIGGASALSSGKKGKNAQNAANAGENQLIGTETNAIDQLMGLFFGQGGAAPALSALVPQLLNWTTNPASNPAMTGIDTTLGAQGRSTVNTLQGDIGANTANPAAMATRLFGAGNQSAGQYAAEAIPGLQSTALGGLTNIAGIEQGGISQAMGGLQGLEGIYGARAGGNPSANMLGGLAGSLNSLFGKGGVWSGGSNATSPTPAPSVGGLGFGLNNGTSIAPSQQWDQSTLEPAQQTGTGNPFWAGAGGPTP
jgi:hypothetical protein